MYTATMISPTWITDHIQAVRDALSAAAADDPADDRHRLARLLSEALGGLQADAPARSMLDGGPDFEADDGWPWTSGDDARSLDDVLADLEATPIEVLARDFAIPPVSGGAPFIPSAEDWADFAQATDDRDWYREIDAQAAGLPI